MPQPVGGISYLSAPVTPLAGALMYWNNGWYNTPGIISVDGSALAVAGRASLGTIGTAFAGNIIAGVQNGTAALAGQIGEVITSTVSATAAAATGAVGNITSIVLTPGDWKIHGQCVISSGATGLTSGSAINMSIVTTSATNGVSGNTMDQESVLALLANGLFHLTLPSIFVNISATTTYYLTNQMTYVAGSPTTAGTITARRMR